FKNAVNPNVAEFNQMPEFIVEKLDPEKHKKVAMFCTGGIRCEKFAPLMKDLGFETVFQLEGGILKYLEEIPAEENLWQGECFVFDERITVNRETFHQAKSENDD
ncbi:MAG: rhodanese-like domain-containing protein, partial [Pyrinomonadaceae bacterium]